MSIQTRLYLSLVCICLLVLGLGGVISFDFWQSFANQPAALERAPNMNDNLKGHMLFILLSIASVIAILIITGILTIRYIFNHIGADPEHILIVANKIVSGDLTLENKQGMQNVKPDTIMGAIIKMQATLLSTIVAVRSGMDKMFSAANEIAIGNQDLARRTLEEAEGLEITATAIGQLTATVKQNSDHAKEANDLAHVASDVAKKGGEAVDEVISMMEKINDSSKRIVDIISVIDGIAFQTNILALNAAVEAARAGEAGRGFAVVATEVRNLAQRSASAAKEIQTLIDHSVTNADIGREVANHAGTIMDDIVDRVDEVTTIINSISQASEEQSIGIEQINQLILKMEQRTQQNSSLVDHAATAATDMQEQSSKLSHLIGQFKVVDSDETHAPTLHIKSSLPIMPISDSLAVAPQLGPDDMEEVARAGFKSVIINLPDYEINQHQPTAADIIAIGKIKGLTIKHQPVVGSQINQMDVNEFGRLLNSLPKPTLAFCRSGKRCSKLFNLLNGQESDIN
ncbi:methyl-accepting chemotaxis protein [Thorsellia anophelis]|uniref:TIGR01244 family protein n=1 Tax=Thorsellia anophelis DSM 18579 TaxID=1123402 RepID=A0A1I0EAL4_9GAMM|nr:methyl-accepting chemotaxis protein [Thorsellia anophelis]SET41898.1 TIGR01244 family protein [Thorsellia anophelis DSM 18579]